MVIKKTNSHVRDILLGGDKRTDKPIHFKAIKNIYWEDWGCMRLMFREGEVYDGILHSDGEVTAEVSGVSDYVDKSEIEILSATNEE